VGSNGYRDAGVFDIIDGLRRAYRDHRPGRSRVGWGGVGSFGFRATRHLFSGSEQAGPDERDIYIAGFFAGGSVASVIAAWCFLNYGWWAVVVLGTSLALTALIYSLGENPEAKESGFRA
jgi:hypothetical protein